MNRRDFIAMTIAGTNAAGKVFGANAHRQVSPRILLRSSWQTVNIGDIAHTPGVLALLERHIPEAEVTLWPSRVDNGVDEMLMRRFPRLTIVRNEADRKRAFDECDFLLHGSGPSLVAEKDVERWSNATQKPYGVYGITFSATESTATIPRAMDAQKRTIEVLSSARFVYFRDSVSMTLAKRLGCTSPVMEFGPDGAFATDLRDDVWGDAFLKANDLKPERYLCCIPRLRFTPYWKIPEKNQPMDEVKHRRNEEMKEHDHAPHRRAIVNVVRRSGLKVLICPEDRTQMEVGRDMLYDPLPDDVKASCVWKPDYWLPAQAVSIYARSAGLFGNEMHSPILAIGQGVPAIVCRWSEQTSKGIMWRDIGLGDWLFDFDDPRQVERLPDAVLKMAEEPEKAKSKAADAREFVIQRQAQALRTLKRTFVAKS